MNQRYTLLATVSCNHQYFREGLFRSINFSIGEDSDKLMWNLGIILKPFSGGFHLLSSNPDLLVSEFNTDSLQIYLNCSDSYYINYTNLSNYSPTKDILYFNNLSAQLVPNKDGFLLHSDEFVGKNEVIELSNGKLKIPSFDSTNAYVFQDALNDDLPIEYITQSGLDPSEFSFTNIPQGLVQVLSGNEVVQKVYYSPIVVWKKPLGVIELFITDLSNHFKANGQVKYQLNFSNRHTIWKYFLVDPVYQKFNALSVINKDKDAIFSSPQKQKIQENTDVIVFESKIKLPLSEYSEDAFQLVDNFNADLRSGKVVIKILPQASPEQLFIEPPPNDQFIYSHIYI